MLIFIKKTQIRMRGKRGPSNPNPNPNPNAAGLEQSATDPYALGTLQAQLVKRAKKLNLKVRVRVRAIHI